MGDYDRRATRWIALCLAVLAVVAALALAGSAAFESLRTWRADSLEDTCCP
jgi:hypothetical protein